MSYFIFWQNIISPHQSPFLLELAKKVNVTLVVEREMDMERIEQKWETPSIDGIEVIVAPSESQIESILSLDAVQIFSGIDAYPMVYKAFKLAVKKRCWIAVLAEPYQWQGFKGWLRKLKYRYLSFLYDKSIQALFATGQTGVRCFVQAGFSPNKVIHWGYFVQLIRNTQNLIQIQPNEILGNTPRLLFVGKLDRNKNVLGLVKTLKNRTIQDYSLSVIGGGECIAELQKIVVDTPNIRLIGNISNREVQSLMQEHDLLILPSLYDGWGAVVNEALMNGMRVITSENCGASVLLDGEKRGEVFYFKHSPTLSEVLDKWIKRGRLRDEEREEIRSWAECSISGKVAVGYFLDKIKFLRGDALNDVPTPWLSLRNSK